MNWPVALPIAALALLVTASLSDVPPGPLLSLLCAGALMGAVVAAVHHAEVVAHRVSEPFGTLVLGLAITVIEAALIVSLMLSGGAASATLPRDTLYATVMIIGNGVVGVCVLWSVYVFVQTVRHRDHFLP